MKTVKNILWLPWTLFHSLAATFVTIFFMFIKENDGRPYWFFKHLSRFWGTWVACGFGLKLSVFGLENLDLNRRYVFVANHSSFIDPIVLMKALPFSMVTMAKKELLQVFGLGYGLKKSKVIFIDREKSEARVDVVKDMVALLRKTNLSPYIFPEGGRKNGQGSFKTGAVRVAIECGFPIVPIEIVGSNIFWPKGTFWRLNRERVVQVFIHEPIDTGYLFGDSDDEKEVEYLTNLAREEIYGV